MCKNIYIIKCMCATSIFIWGVFPFICAVYYYYEQISEKSNAMFISLDSVFLLEHHPRSHCLQQDVMF